MGPWGPVGTRYKTLRGSRRPLTLWSWSVPLRCGWNGVGLPASENPKARKSIHRPRGRSDVENARGTYGKSPPRWPWQDASLERATYPVHTPCLSRDTPGDHKGDPFWSMTVLKLFSRVPWDKAAKQGSRETSQARPTQESSYSAAGAGDMGSQEVHEPRWGDTRERSCG